MSTTLTSTSANSAMQTLKRTHWPQRATSVLRAMATGFATVGLVIACSPDEILNVEDIDVVKPEQVTNAEALPAALAGALGNFGVALNGGGDINQVALSGMISDEYINTETFPTRIEVDQRRQQFTNGSLTGTFYALQQARASADFAARGFAEFSPTNRGFAEALVLGAFSHILMAENYCGAVPISREVSPGSFEFGPGLTTRELLGRAIAKADSALAIMGGDTATATEARAARIAKGRALLDLDDPAGAAAAVTVGAGVPTTFQYNYVHSEVTGRQNNGTWNLVQNSGRFGVASGEGTNGLPFRVEGDTATVGGVRDPRVANVRRPTNQGRGFDGATNMWWQLKYPVRAASTTIADGVEARLIQAEAFLRAGDYPNMLLTLQNLANDAGVRAVRGYTRAVPVPVAVVGQVAQENQLFKERAYWLFLTSHRLGDLRRLSRPTTAAPPAITGYGRGIETVFPTGTYHKPGTYGTDVNSPIPQAEDNNPNFVRAACGTGTP
jgi:hypothetical protein